MLFLSENKLHLLSNYLSGNICRSIRCEMTRKEHPFNTQKNISTKHSSLSQPHPSNTIDSDNNSAAVVTNTNDEMKCCNKSKLSITNDIDEILSMTKIELCMALSFFLGKERGKEIKKKEEKKYITSCCSKVTIKYGSIIHSHILTQIKKLWCAHLTFDG